MAMVRIENTSGRQLDISPVRQYDGAGVLVVKEGRPMGMVFKIPRADVNDKGERVNGVGEIDEDVLAELLEKDAWTKALFDSGDLVVKKAHAPKAVAAHHEDEKHSHKK